MTSQSLNKSDELDWVVLFVFFICLFIFLFIYLFIFLLLLLLFFFFFFLKKPLIDILVVGMMLTEVMNEISCVLCVPVHL